MTPENKPKISLFSMKEKRSQKIDGSNKQGVEELLEISSTEETKNTVDTKEADITLTEKEVDEKKKPTISLTNKKIEITLDGENEEKKPTTKIDLTKDEKQTEENSDISTALKSSENNRKEKNANKVEKSSTIKNGVDTVGESEEVAFSNYKSDFQKEEETIFEKIKKLRTLPKTRPIFVGGIIGVTVLGLLGLSFLNPEVHSIENYKASLLGTKEEAQKKPNNASSTKSVITWQEEIVNIGGNSLTLESMLSENGQKLYKYNGVEYKTIEEIEILIKKDKVKGFLLKRNQERKQQKENKETIKEKILKRNNNSSLDLLKNSQD